MAHGKKYLEAAKLVDRERLYQPLEAVELVKETTTVGFDASIEAHLRLGVDPRHADQMVRGTVVLPHGTGKVVRVAVFAQGEKAQEALRAGADEVGGEDLVKKIEAGWLDFDVALATPDSMGLVGRLGKILGRRGLMPNPKAGTITFDLERAIKEVKAGRVEYKVDKAGIIHVSVGKSSFEPNALLENLATLVDAVNRAKPAGAKGQYLKTHHHRQHHGPGDPGRRAGRARRRRGLNPCRRVAGEQTRRRSRDASPDDQTDGPPQTACVQRAPPRGDVPDLIRRTGPAAREGGTGTTTSTPRQPGTSTLPGGPCPCDVGSPPAMEVAMDRRRGVARPRRAAHRRTPVRVLR